MNSFTQALRGAFDLQQLGKMLEAARLNNARLSVSGILLYEAGSFIQVLEGEQLVVQSLFDKIALDERHYRVIVLRKGPIKTRSFSEWSMGFVTLDPQLLREFPRRHGFSSNGSLIDDSAAALTVLDGFRNGRWRCSVPAPPCAPGRSPTGIAGLCEARPVHCTNPAARRPSMISSSSASACTCRTDSGGHEICRTKLLVTCPAPDDPPVAGPAGEGSGSALQGRPGASRAVVSRAAFAERAPSAW